MPRKKVTPPTDLNQPLEEAVQHLPSSPIKRSMPSWAESITPREISKAEMLEYSDAFTVIMGIPEVSRVTHKTLFSWLTGEHVTIIENASYVQRGVLYLTPSDFNFFMAARKTKEATPNV